LKVILDTNVLISGVYFGGYPYRILEAWNNDKLILIVSKEILDEYGRIGRMLADQFPLINFEPMLKFVMTNAVIVKPGKLRQPVCNDPDDDKFFSCAMSAGCKTIISGDKHLLKVSGFKEISVLKPREFVERYL
jgi:putative PIN family toxin of toxin-antitoxin system